MKEMGLAGRTRLNTLRGVATVLGIGSGLIGIYHGYNEFLQGVVSPSGVLINAIGPPCQGSSCFPAMTIIPDFEVTGLLAIGVSIVILGLSLMLGSRRRGYYLVGLAVVQLLVGGGFLPPLLGIIGGAVAVRASRPGTVSTTPEGQTQSPS